MDVYTIRNQGPENVSITLGYVGGVKPDNLAPGEVWVKTGFAKMLAASNKAAAMRFKCAMSDVKTTCIGEPA